MSETEPSTIEVPGLGRFSRDEHGMPGEWVAERPFKRARQVYGRFEYEADQGHEPLQIKLMHHAEGFETDPDVATRELSDEAVELFASALRRPRPYVDRVVKLCRGPARELFHPRLHALYDTPQEAQRTYDMCAVLQLAFGGDPMFDDSIQPGYGDRNVWDLTDEEFEAATPPEYTLYNREGIRYPSSNEQVWHSLRLMELTLHYGEAVVEHRRSIEGEPALEFRLDAEPEREHGLAILFSPQGVTGFNAYAEADVLIPREHD